MHSERAPTAKSDRITFSIPRPNGGVAWPIAMVLVAGIGAYTYLQTNARPGEDAPALTAESVASVAMPASGVRQAVQSPQPSLGPRAVLPGALAPAGFIPSSPPIQAAPTAQSEFVATSDPSIRSIPDPTVAGKVFELLKRLPSVQTGSGAGPVIYAFYDPRCPYCHKAFNALEGGDLPIAWIPVPVIGDAAAGYGLVRAIMGAPDRLAALKEAMAGKLTGVASVSAEQDLELAAAYESFAMITTSLQNAHGGQQGPIGVPTFIVPSTGGKATAIVGYDPALKDKLLAAYSGS